VAGTRDEHGHQRLPADEEEDNDGERERDMERWKKRAQPLVRSLGTPESIGLGMTYLSDDENHRQQGSTSSPPMRPSSTTTILTVHGNSGSIS